MFNLDFSVHALRGGDHRPPLYDWQTRTVWLKNIKIETTAETKTPTSWMPLKQAKTSQINFKVVKVYRQILTSNWNIL